MQRTSISACSIWFSLCVLLFLGSWGQVAKANPELPIISNQTFAVTNAAYGAVGDGATDNAAAIQRAITDAAAHGGGTVLIPANGTLSSYLSGPIGLSNGINFQVDSGVLLQMLPYGTYPGSTNFIGGAKLHDVELSGSGTIDGQGAAWWTAYNSSNALTRPHLVDMRTSTNVLVQGVTLQNSPMFHLVLMGGCINVTVQGITIDTLWPSPNTDGIDLVGTHCLVQNCSISDGDDDIALSPTAGAVATDILVTNCTFGAGYGVAIGSNTAGGLSNLTVVSCTFTGTQYGISMKSDNNTNTTGTLNGRGGLVQNLSYSNLTMTNIVKTAISMDSYYNEYSSGYGMTPFGASTQAVGAVAIPVWRNITISNVSAVVTGRIAGVIWGRKEAPVANVVLNHVTIKAPGTFNVYNAQGIEFIDSPITVPATTNTFNLYNAQITITNSAVVTNVVKLGGLAMPGTNNSMAFFNATAAITDTNMLGAPSITLGASTVTVSRTLSLGAGSTLNFALGTNTAEILVTGNLALNGTLNVSDAGGFTNTPYTLLTCSGTVTQNALTIGTTPNPAFTYTISTNTPGQVNLIVGSPPPPDPFVTWQSYYFNCTACPQAQPDADPLGTGMSNTNKFLAGFNPTFPAAYLHVISTVETNTTDINVTYLGANGDNNWSPGIASRTNILEFAPGTADGSYSNDFASAGQTNILTGGTGLGIITNMLDPGGARNIPSRYYRIRVLLP